MSGKSTEARRKRAYKIICQNPGITQAELCRLMKEQCGNIESLLAGLEKAGLLVYEQGPHLYPYKED